MAKEWGFLTNHALVLIHVFNNPRSTLREIASEVGITERAALNILRQMELDGCAEHERVGRKNHYTVDLRAVAARRQGRFSISDIVRGVTRLIENLPDDGEATSTR